MILRTCLRQAGMRRTFAVQGKALPRPYERERQEHSQEWLCHSDAWQSSSLCKKEQRKEQNEDGQASSSTRASPWTDLCAAMTFSASSLGT